jgi:UDP-N-acetylglucosamine--N-acetylmuramyl-(pentapeptide) pyrophosphoryl-undecaprenol N-acetylglucosamine transferase
MLDRVIISGGGTGGHIFPALAIADAIKAYNPQADILFVGAKGRMEMEKVPQAGYRIEGLNITGIQRSLSFSNFLFPFRLLHSLLKARSIVKQFKPQVVVGTGGFASGPTLFAASGLNIPTVIQEQNSVPGITNSRLAKRAVKVCVAYPGLEKYFSPTKIVMTGNPVRKAIEHNTYAKPDALRVFGLEAGKKTVFVYGGSQGALAVNQGVMNALNLWKNDNIQVIWQTGKSFFPNARQAVLESGAENIRVFAFIENMPAAYACSDLVVCRAGALSISEICVSGLPSVLVPLPTAAGDHQTKNAQALVQAGAAVLLSNQDAPAAMGSKVLDMIDNPGLLKKLSQGAQKLAVTDSANKIVDVLKEIVH